MAIVATYHFPEGTGHVDDSYIRSITPEQRQRNREEFERYCMQMIYANEMRKKEKEAAE